ncbi:MAG: hemolysin family protein [bacterium]
MLLIIAALAVLLVLLMMSAFFSSAETALFLLNPLQIHRIRRRHPRKAAAIEHLLATPTALLSSVLIGNTIVNVAAANLGYIIVRSFTQTHAETIAISVMTVLLIIFGEVGPKRFAMRRPEQLAVLYVRPLGWLITGVTPIRRLLERITDASQQVFRPKKAAVTGGELLTAVDVGHSEGLLNHEERMMLDGIIRLENLQARDVLTPRVDIVGLAINDLPEQHRSTARGCRFHHLPVYRENLDHIEGFLDVRAYLLDPAGDLQAHLHPHFFVPDTAPLDNLLTIFQQQELSIAVVIDEYGGTAGLITRGDILDEIVDFAAVADGGLPATIEAAGDNQWITDGTTSLEDLNYELDLHLDAGGADRIAGWITVHMKRLPRVGDRVEAQECRVTVMKMRRHRITSVMVERLPPPPGDAVEGGG